MYKNKKEQERAERVSRMVTRVLLAGFVIGSVTMGLIYCGKFGWVKFYSC